VGLHLRQNGECKFLLCALHNLDTDYSSILFVCEQHGRHEPEVVISHHLRHLAGPCKELGPKIQAYVKASAHDKSDGMYANNMQLVTHQIDHWAETGSWFI